MISCEIKNQLKYVERERALLNHFNFNFQVKQPHTQTIIWRVKKVSKALMADLEQTDHLAKMAREDRRVMMDLEDTPD